MKHLLIPVAASALLAGSASAATLVWADWTAADSSSASGTLGSGTVAFSGALSPAAQVAGGTNFWAVNSGIYTPTGAENPPPDSDIIRLTGGAGTGTQTLTFSQAVVNPLMAIMSLGRPGFDVSYDFDQPFDIVNQGVGHFGGSATALSELPGDVLNGREGHGLIQFQGTFTSLSWTIPTGEFWHGFQIAYDADDQMAPIPLPGSFGLVLAGLGGLGLLARRRRARG